MAIAVIKWSDRFCTFPSFDRFFNLQPILRDRSTYSKIVDIMACFLVFSCGCISGAFTMETKRVTQNSVELEHVTPTFVRILRMRSHCVDALYIVRRPPLATAMRMQH